MRMGKSVLASVRVVCTLSLPGLLSPATAQAGRTVKIAMAGPLTGPVAAAGEDSNAGVRL
jgi:ABC-type branched-subunit amino acid transport system substrate-binding protein